MKKHLKLSLALTLCASLSFKTAPHTNVVSFASVRGLIILEATVDETTGFFIIDTGTDDLMLNRRYFEGDPSSKTFFGINGQVSEVQTKYCDLSIGDFKTRSDAKIIDFSAIETHTGLPVMGAVGNTVFENCEVVFDYIFKELTVYHLDKNGNPLNHRALHEPVVATFPFTLKGSMPSVEATVGGNPVRLGLDSGAGVNIFDKKKKTELDCCLKETGKKELAGFGATTQMSPTAQISDITVGEIHCKPMKTCLASLKQLNRELAGPDIDGIMGHEFLSRYRTGINFKKKEIYIRDTDFVLQQLATAQLGKMKNKK